MPNRAAVVTDDVGPVAGVRRRAITLIQSEAPNKPNGTRVVKRPAYTDGDYIKARRAGGLTGFATRIGIGHSRARWFAILTFQGL
jgi:hypothetical protein